MTALAGDPKKRSQGRPSWLWTLAFGVALPLVVFAVLAGEVWERESFDWDSPLLRAMQDLQSGPLTALAKVVTHTGSALFVTVLLAAAVTGLLLARLRREALYLAVATGGAMLLNVILKDTFERPRPEVSPHLVAAQSSSFPSGHTMSAMALATALLFVAWPTRWRWPVAAFGFAYAFAVGLSRVYLGVHYPSDVLAGWAVAIAWAAAVSLVVPETRDEVV